MCIKKANTHIVFVVLANIYMQKNDMDSEFVGKIKTTSFGFFQYRKIGC